MDNYLLFLVISTATVLSPGPGVMLTLANALKYGAFGALGGILGIAAGTFIVAGFSATGLALLLTTSTLAFNAVKYIGAAYLVYLGIKMWRAPRLTINEVNTAAKSRQHQFLEGLMLQLVNPKAILFFMAIFPQFVDFSASYSGQFLLLVATYSTLVILIHVVYAYLASFARRWLSSEKTGRLVNRIGGGIFVGFGAGLARL